MYSDGNEIRIENRQAAHWATRQRPGVVTAVVLCLHLAAGAVAEDDPPDQAPADGRADVVREFAIKHRIVVAGTPATPLELRRQALMNLTNPTRADVFGSVFLWTLQRRPMAIGGLYHYQQPVGELGREFQSLTTTPLRGVFGDDQFWNSTGPGVDFQAVPGASKPAAATPARLRQMKQIAATFTAQISRPGVDPEALRLLPRPLYRYQSTDSKVTDGALFAYVQGTDPEAMLLVEAREIAEGAQWQYAFVRCTAWSVTARLNEMVVFDVPFYDFSKHDSTLPYVVLPRLKVKP